MPLQGEIHPDWEYDEKTDCVVCSCLFRFGAEHPDSEPDDGGYAYSCPNCLHPKNLTDE